MILFFSSAAFIRQFQQQSAGADSPEPRAAVKIYAELAQQGSPALRTCLRKESTPGHSLDVEFGVPPSRYNFLASCGGQYRL